ncbi:MAG: SRPBCC family protein [Nitratireductor sp.]|nr:SRPBCC family protein [Nitratireductor sp.]
MNDLDTVDAYGVLVEPATYRIQRLLPGPTERVWNYLTKSDLRRRWLAAGDMGMAAGTNFTLKWRNSELTDPPGKRPDGFGEEHSMESRIVEVDPLRKLAFTWGGGEVSFELEPQGEDVLLTVTHRRISDRANTVMVGAGWHMHLDVLAAKLAGHAPEPFWDGWVRLKGEYEKRIPA